MSLMLQWRSCTPWRRLPRTRRAGARGWRSWRMNRMIMCLFSTGSSPRVNTPTRSTTWPARFQDGSKWLLQQGHWRFMKKPGMLIPTVKQSCKAICLFWSTNWNRISNGGWRDSGLDGTRFSRISGKRFSYSSLNVFHLFIENFSLFLVSIAITPENRITNNRNFSSYPKYQFNF